MTTALDDLVSLLDLERLEENLFRGRSPDEDRQRVFGGQVAGQALVAAGRTVPGRSVHSLHAYFLRPGDTKVPIVYEVDRLRDGRTFTTRRVTAVQHGRPIFALSASFQEPEPSLEHQAPMPDAPDPESLPGVAERIRAAGDLPPEFAARMLERERPIDSRPVDAGSFWSRAAHPPRSLVWIRADGTLPDDPLLHQCIVTYASDMTLLETAIRPHPVAMTDPGLVAASLDHAMWFHRPVRADAWMLFAQDSWSMSSSRGFTVAQLFTREGALAVSVAQEGFLRYRPPSA